MGRGSLREEKRRLVSSLKKIESRRRGNFGVNFVSKESRHRPAKGMQNEGEEGIYRGNRYSLLD